ncbi:hypothetical protein [Paraburkholderia susongensis]|nr:hypothetical protein [Paraburkholderia susongensis]
MAYAVGGLVGGCDEQKVADAVYAVKLDAIAFGKSIILDVRR